MVQGKRISRRKDVTRPPSMRETAERRWSEVARKILDLSFGTLWWVEEPVWQALLPHYDPDSKRAGHPGLSCRQKPIEDLYSSVPMLHGHSHPRGFPVIGLTEDEPKRTTYFGPLLGPLPVHEWLPWPSGVRVRANRHKSRLTEEEKTMLADFLEKRRLLA